MGRPKSIDDDTLLRIARETFLEKGVGAPASEIARRAGVSEAAIFKRYPTKAELFFAALGFPKFDAKKAIEKSAAKKTVPVQLEAILLEFLKYLNEMMPILATLISHPSFNPIEFHTKFNEAPINTLVSELAAFIETKKRAGEIGDCDPMAVTGVLFAAIHSFAMFEYMGIHKASDGSSKMLIHMLVGVVWAGIKPNGKRNKRGK